MEGMGLGAKGGGSGSGYDGMLMSSMESVDQLCNIGIPLSFESFCDISVTIPESLDGHFTVCLKPISNFQFRTFSTLLGENLGRSWLNI
jgi:hypothetical protein